MRANGGWQQTQLELFETLPQATSPRRLHVGMGRLTVRHDHAMLATMVGLIGCSVVFAFGVERGKQLARAERALLAPLAQHQPAAAPAADTKSSVEKPASVSSTKAEERTPKTATATPSKKPAEPKAIAERPGFGVQVVSYSQLPLAQRELKRLKQQGESAFLVTSKGRVALVVGPFASKQMATTKLVRLRESYQDCFLRVL